MTKLETIKRATRRPGLAVRRYFRFRTVYAAQRPAIMRKHIYTGAMGTVYFHVMTGMFFVYFGNTIGMSKALWGLMGGLASFALSTQIVSALITQRSRQRKALWFYAGVIGRLLRTGGIVAAFFLWRGDYGGAAAVLIFSVVVSNICDALATPPWLSWLTDIIPEEEHGHFWSRRTFWCNISVLLYMVPAAFLLDGTAGATKPVTALLVFVLTGALGLVDLVIHGTIPEPRMAPCPSEPFLTRIMAPLADRRFRPWLIFNVVWTASMTFGGALVMVYLVRDLGFEKRFGAAVLSLTGAAMLGSILASTRAGALVDAYGPRRVIRYGYLGWAFLPAFVFVATPRTALYCMAVGNLCGAMFSTTAMTAQNKLITRFTGPERTAMYVAVSMCLGSAAGGIGAIASGFALERLEPWTFTLGAFEVVPFRMIFAASLLLRVLAVVVLVPRVRDPLKQRGAVASGR